MIVLTKILQFIVSLSVIVIIHELGHFLFAKLFKTRVEKFYLFFDPWFSLFKYKRGETEYGVGWLPLGGYVKISGMIDESMDKEQMKQAPKPYEFRSKPAWQRLMIMVAGVLFNFILAVFIYVMVLFKWGDTYLPTENAKFGIVTDSLGMEIGFRNGDKILSVDNQEIEDFHDIIADILLNERNSVQVDRNGQTLNIEIRKEHIAAILKSKARIMDARMSGLPMRVSSFGKDSQSEAAGMKENDILTGLDGMELAYYDEFTKYLASRKGKTVTASIERGSEQLEMQLPVDANGKLGVYLEDRDKLEVKTIEYSFAESIPAGMHRGATEMKNYLKQFKLIFSKDTKGYESLGGFITIGSIFPDKWNWMAFWSLTAFLSIILGIMNILPIPALDGGHVMFLLFEVVSGRKPGDKFLEYAQITGMILLLALLIFANGNDIVRLFRN